jgi:hypothetical protein
MTTFKPGAKIRVAAIFRDPASRDQLLDPEIVSLRVMDPQGKERDMTPVRDHEGHYHADALADLPGRWWWRWEADGGIEDGFFDVSPPPRKSSAISSGSKQPTSCATNCSRPPRVSASGERAADLLVVLSRQPYRCNRREESDG